MSDWKVVQKKKNNTQQSEITLQPTSFFNNKPRVNGLIQFLGSKDVSNQL